MNPPDHPEAGPLHPDPLGRRRHIVAVLRISLALLLLVLVGRALPWKDQLSHAAPGAESLQAKGTIEGDWKAETVLFRFDADVELAAGWPAEASRARAAGEALSVTRRTTDEDPGYDWQPGMPAAFRHMETSGLVIAMLLFFGAALLITTRWWRLLALAGCRTSWFNALRLTFLGLFFNSVMPGQTGGDLVKGVLAAKENPGRRADAVVSVFVDRALGLFALAILAMGVILASGDEFDWLRGPLLLLLLVIGVGGYLYTKKRLRRALGLSWLVDHLPLGDKLRDLDRAALLYLRHPVELGIAFVLSLGNHLVVVVAVWVLGAAIGVERAEVSLRDYFVLVPIANIVGAIPLAPGGWGLGEAAYKVLFERIGASGTLGVAVSVTFRLCQLALGLIGGIFLLLPKSRAEVRSVESAHARD